MNGDAHAGEIADARSVRARLEIDLDAVRHNLAVIRRLSGGARVMPIVKGDAYGTGAAALARALQSCGVPAFGVDNVAEGIALRAAGIAEPILVLDADAPENSPRAVAHRLAPGIANEDQLAHYERAAARSGVLHPIWLAANIGFNRAGHRDALAFAGLAARAAACEHLRVSGVFAHLTNSNGDGEISRCQMEEFTERIELARRALGREVETSLFASHGLVRWGRCFPTDWVRPGALLYGEHSFLPDLVESPVWPAVGELQPAVRLRARILHLMGFARAEGVGYGQHHRARRGQRLATIAIGFGSGYPGTTGLEALVQGRRAPVFGEPGMDALQLDVSGIAGVEVGGWATLIGSDGGEHISAAELAQRAGMNLYQLLSGLSCHRVYLSTRQAAAGHGGS